MSGKGNDPILSFASPDDWAAWLAEHHATAGGVWLKIAKKETGIASITYAEALDAALCYGWIDGQKGSFDEQYWLQRFTRRTPQSRWSQSNRAKATALIEQGAMQPAGQREVEQAQADGRWDAAYAGQAAAEVPADLRAALDAVPDPVSGVLVYPHRGGGDGCRQPARPRPRVAGDAAAQPLPDPDAERVLPCTSVVVGETPSVLTAW
jgi:uncharacterized protein YdeI (YjbR/CyaY-like superfamily)